MNITDLVSVCWRGYIHGPIKPTVIPRQWLQWADASTDLAMTNKIFPKFLLFTSRQPKLIQTLTIDGTKW